MPYSLYEFTESDPAQFATQQRQFVSDLESQLNASTGVYGATNNSIPTGLKGGDVVAQNTQGKISIGVADATGAPKFLSANDLGLNAGLQGFLGTQNGTGLPTTTQFPSDNNWGYWINNTSSRRYLYLNSQGTLYQFISGLTLADLSLDSTLAQYKGYQSGILNPTTSQFPNNNDWGFYNNTATGFNFFSFNSSGTIVNSILGITNVTTGVILPSLQFASNNDGDAGYYKTPTTMYHWIKYSGTVYSVVMA